VTLRPPTSAPSTIGPYRVEREIARGGMGIVYLARDTRLDRAVAIKALPDDFASDPERLARFEREAKLVASLNHPNIAGIHGIEESEGRRYLALEHVEGETLADRIARGPLPIGEAVDICLQIASGIEAAHEAGVIHRDLKPGNVLVTPGDQVKIVDFGLAKGRVAESGIGDSPAHSPTYPQSPTIAQPPTVMDSPTLAHSPTFGSPATMPGVILGTAGYLSPEQARGKPVDRRTDIWSFGCVLYECLTGRLAFPGETVSDTIAKILERDIDWSALPASTPPAVRDLLHRCLEKDPRKRLRDIGDARLTLEEVKAGGVLRGVAGATAAAPLKPAARHWIFLALVAGLIGGIAAGVLLGRGKRQEERVVRLSVAVPSDLRPRQAAVSDDDRFFVMLAFPKEKKPGEDPVSHLYVRALDDTHFRQLQGTERAQNFTVSPDSRWVSFIAPVSERSTDGHLVTMPIDGSAPPVAIAKVADDWQGNVVWLESGDFAVAVAEGGKFLRLQRSGSPKGEPKPLTAPGYNGTFALVDGLPKDRGILMQGTSYAEGAYHVDIAVLDLKSGQVKILVRDAGSPVYASTGHLLFSRGGALFAVPLDLGSLEIKGTPSAIEGDLRINQSWMNASVGLTRGGTLRYNLGGDVARDRHAVIVDPDGRATEWSGEHQPFENWLGTSPDGERFASVIANEGAIYEIWISERGRSTSQRVVARAGADCGTPVFSPDGARLAYSQISRQNTDGIWVVDANGGGAPRRVAKTTPEVQLSPSSWSPDGRWIAGMRAEAGRPEAVIVRADATDADPAPLLGPGTRTFVPAFCPNGRSIAFISDQTGKFEAYVARWNGERIEGQPVLVSSGGVGSVPHWGSDGKHIYYMNPVRTRVMSSAITDAPRLAASTPVETWNVEPYRVATITGDVMMTMLPGNRLLMIQKGANEDDITRYELALHYDEVIRSKTRLH
jgi:eukaryotic-like serine/threonine-protein kinase